MPVTRAAVGPLPKADRLTRQYGAEGALHAMFEVGPAGVSIEGLTKRLGVTKGSVYWHFSSRADLIGAALEYWEQTYTLDVINRLSSIRDPMDRLRALLVESSFG